MALAMHKGYRWIVQAVVLGLMLIVLTSQNVWAEDNSLEANMRVQVLLGATRFDGLELSYYDTSTDPPEYMYTDFTWMPLLGVTGAIPLKMGSFEMGMEGGLVMQWRSTGVKVYKPLNSSVYVHVENDLYLGDVFLGGYVSRDFSGNMRLYLGLGPLMAGGSYYSDTTQNQSNGAQIYHDSSSASAFGVGVYARIGIEFRLPDKSWMGFSVRALGTEMDFSNVIGTTKVKGVQCMLTFTAKP